MAIKKFNSIDGFSVGSDTQIAVIDNVANVTANSLVVSNKSNLGNVGNITITGGSAGYVLKTDGTGNLSWGIDAAAAGGSNRDIQFNDGGSLNGTSNFTYNSTTSVLTLTGNLITTNATLGNLASDGLVDFSTTTNVSLGEISNLHILGGTPGYVLTTDGYGDLSWEAVGSSGTGFVSIRKDNFTGNGVQTQFPLSAIPSGEDAVEVNLNGLIQQGYVYNVVGSNVVFTTAPVSGANIEITTFGALAIDQTDSQILFINGSNLTGSNNFTFTESNNTLSVNNVSTTANVTAGNIKTNNLLYSNGSPYVFTTSASGSNTQVQYNDSNSFAGSAAFTFDNGTNTLSVTNIVANGSGITYITGSNVSGNVDFAITSNWANTANSVSGTNVTGNVTSAIQSHYANIANSVAGANVTGQVGNALVAGTVYTAAQPNITSVGTLTSLVVSGDATITGNLIVSGNTEYTNVNNLYIKDPIIEMGGGANGAVLSSNDGKDRGSLLHYYTTAPVDAFMGWDNSNAEFAFGSNVSVSSEVVTFNSFGNVRANYFIGDGSLLTNINAGNITGAYSNANVANYLPTYTGNVSANYFIGDGSQLTGLPAQYANSNVANYLPTYTGNVSANYFIGNGSTLTNITGANVTGYVPNANLANTATVAGTVTTNAQPNITSVGTLTDLTVTGTITAGNANIGSGTGGSLTGANLISANYFVGDGSLLTNINAGNITGLYGNANVANYLPTYTGNVSANYFIGNGSTLTSITGSNVIGNVGFAITSNWANTANSILGTNVSGNVTSAIQAHYANIANSVAGANVTGQVGNALVAGTVYTANQPNITNVGTLLGVSITGNLDITGNINATGNLNYSNVNDLVVGDPLIYLGANNTGNLYDLGIVASYNDGTYYHTGIARDATDGTWKLFDQVVAEPTTVIDFANGTYAPFKTGSFTSTGNITATNANLGNLVVANYFSGDGSLLTNINAGNITGAYSNANVANYLPTYTGNVSGNYLISNALTATRVPFVGSSKQLQDTTNLIWDNPNQVLKVGAGGTEIGGDAGYGYVSATKVYSTSLTNTRLVFSDVNHKLVDSANLSFTGTELNVIGIANISGNILSSNANLGNAVVANYFIGNGSLLTGLPAQYANSNVANYLPTYTGNVSANYFIGDGSLLTNINAANITGSYSNANVENYLPTYTGNVSANYFIGNGATLTYITGSNVSGNVDFAITSNWANTANSISGANVSGNVDSAIQSNYANIANSVAGSNISGNVADAVHAYYADVANSVAGANVSGNVDFAITSNWANTANSISGTNVSGNVDFAITSNWANTANSIAGTNVTGQVSNALVAGTVYTNAQPNITSVGTLSNLDVTGNISAGNANLGNVVVANYFIGNGSLLTGLPASYANSNVANYLPTYTGNISANYFIGNGSTITYITGSNVSGNVDFAITSNWANTANSVAGANVSGTVANATYATSAGSADSATTAGTVTTASQPNITSFGTLTELTVDGLTDLGPIGNVTITGGTSGYVLTTNGAGDLSWQAAGGSAGPGFVNITKNSFTGNGVQTIFTLTTTPASEASLLVNIDGITQQDAAYSLSGSDVTFASAPLPGEIVEIASYGSIGIGSNTTVLFNDAGDIGNVSAFSFNKYSNTLSVTNIDTTSVNFDTGVITVAGANAGIFSSGVDNINLGLGANVTVGSSSGNTTVQGNLIAGNISTTSNLEISGTATISNLKVNDLYSNRTPVSVTTNTIVDSFSVNKYRSAKYTMRVNSDDGYQAVEVLLIHDGSNSYVTIYGSLSTIGTDIVTLSSNILSGNVRLLATTGSANTTVNLLGTYVAD